MSMVVPIVRNFSMVPNPAKLTMRERKIIGRAMTISISRKVSNKGVRMRFWRSETVSAERPYR